MSNIQHDGMLYRQEPIPSPFSKSDPPLFKAKFFHVFRVFLLFVCTVYVPLICFAWQISLSPHVVLICGVVSYAVALVLSVVSVYGFQVSLTRKGIGTYSFWGVYHDVAWDEVVEVRPANVLGLRYLKLKCCQNRKILWLPLFLANMSQFQTAVQQYTSTQHPLHQFFRAA
jgi:hypothetical protein